MTVRSSFFSVQTNGFCDIRDITPFVKKSMASLSKNSGLITVFVAGSTAGITTIEYESGAVEDLKLSIERIVPQDIKYNHDSRWGDGNGFAHVRAALLGPSLSIPFINGELQIGTWQQIILVDFDNRPRTREISVNIIGD